MNKIILIGGGTASGKTYIVNKVIEQFGNDNVTHIKMDDYYKDLTNLTMEERNKVNFDHPKSLDWKLLRSDLKKLKEGETIKKPIYDFTVHNRSDKTETVTPKKIIIVEGIMALVDKEVRSLASLKVFISCIREKRFLRRLTRDSESRGRTYESIINQYFETVQPMYEEVIAPSKNYADVVIENSKEDIKPIDILRRIIIAVLEN